MTDIVPIPALRPSSEFPTNADRNAGVFNSKAFNWANSSRDMAADMSAIADAARTNAIATNEIAVDAKNATAANKTAAQNAQAAAELAAANAAGSAAFYGRWSELTGALNMPANVTHNGKDWRLVRNLPDVTAAEPGVSDAWEAVAGSSIDRITITSSRSISASDHGAIVDVATSATVTLATSGIAGGFWCYLRAGGASQVTIATDGVLIDGVSSGYLPAGMSVLLQFNGTEFTATKVSGLHVVTLTYGTTWQIPIGVRSLVAKIQGGGASGVYTGGAARTGGGAGGYAQKRLVVAPGASCTYSIGAGGSSVSSGTVGNAGGTTSFAYGGATIMAYGGTAANQYVANPGGSASGGDINLQGGPGVNASNLPNLRYGGDSVFGFGGNDWVDSTGYGSGGGGANAATKPGRQGVIILEM